MQWLFARVLTTIGCAAGLLVGVPHAGGAAIKCLCQPPTLSAHQSVAPDVDARQLLEVLGIGPEFYAGFSSGTPLTPAERERSLKLMFALRKVPLLAMEANRRRPLSIGAIPGDPQACQGEVYQLYAMATRVMREDVPAEMRETLGFDAYYRCELQAFGLRLTLLTLSVPERWSLDVPLEETCGGPAIFVKLLPDAEAPAPEADHAERGGDQAATAAAKQPSLLFVSTRLAWYPQSLLGRLQMDVSLLDDVRDRTDLVEREAFYQLLAAVRRAADGVLRRDAQEQLAERRQVLQRLVRNRDLDPQSLADAERELERANEGASDVVPLFNDPAAQRGKLLVLSGEALRAIRIRVDDPDIVHRFGIDHYYEIEMVTPDSQTNPIVCCVAALPPGMPIGDAIHENIRVTGFFFKSWAFDTHRSAAGEGGSGGKKLRQVAPLLIADTIEQVARPVGFDARQSWQLAGGLCVLILACAAAMWYIRVADRRALARLAASGESLPSHISLESTDDRSAGA